MQNHRRSVSASPGALQGHCERPLWREKIFKRESKTSQTKSIFKYVYCNFSMFRWSVWLPGSHRLLCATVWLHVRWGQERSPGPQGYAGSLKSWGQLSPPFSYFPPLSPPFFLPTYLSLSFSSPLHLSASFNLFSSLTMSVSLCLSFFPFLCLILYLPLSLPLSLLHPWHLSVWIFIF